jgi:hypothetical protein
LARHATDLVAAKFQKEDRLWKLACEREALPGHLALSQALQTLPNALQWCSDQSM